MSNNILLIDDERNFADDRSCVVARSSGAAIEILETGKSFDEIWFDFCLKGMDDIMPVLWYMKKRSDDGNPVDVKDCIIHSSAYSAHGLISSVLTDGGYTSRVVYHHDFF